MSQFHDGGVPPQGGKMVYPESTSDGDALTKPDAGPSEENATKGGPGTPHGSSTEDAFLDESTYQVAGDMSDNGMVVRDLNDVLTDVPTKTSGRE